MRIMDWNVEWMNRWFSGNALPRWGSSELTAAEAQGVARRVMAVIAAVEPDLICLQEGPSAPQEMALFLALMDEETGLAFEALVGGDGGAQKMYALRRIGGAVAAMDYATDAATRALAEPWEADVNGDLLLEGYGFTRLPLVVDVDPEGGAPVRVVILHAKSKYVHNGQRLFQDPARRLEFVSAAMVARRRISAEAFRVRAYLDALVADDPEMRIVVTGDFNDGPGQDYFEQRYLTHNVTDILLGSTFYPQLIFGHALIGRVPPQALFTARFDDFVDGVMDRPLLLDHILTSPALSDQVSAASIAHAAFDAQVTGGGAERTGRPSDHRPVWADITAPLRRSA
ncbi:endonuclease/exonuclease/phosphatase family protein [Pseudoroseicyclus aestuarii]|uniref:Endonuclease/exonuclease/phosphatase family metal-dependent hydrolase n=1 Tax=Pseudoroseicyclus aestuarii TaxID=1795041 RepID=A0A318SQE1_9RHOB|nr:endonuclease/exonuclease/phosphatase family protein [Pseudoroseicyclus aestuarii]PYE83892.1 endonuclease/exonuclease/phosphatase family metal-dependent hydrolase [Pseudoroseicyclus aestuarii]